MGKTEEPIDSLLLELRRGTLVLGVLSQLKEPQYGYSLVQRLSERGMDMDQGTLYPLLRRLEKQELLESLWQIEDARPRRYYKLNDTGIQTLKTLTQEWNEMVKTLNAMLTQGDGEEKR